ncbi:MAG: hypothetical protein VKP57_02735 [Candidatus Sericytochromatia bacterium]|nr:hypothetical protein [Candidatus Sericytochromatia bacterium]
MGELKIGGVAIDGVQVRKVRSGMQPQATAAAARDGQDNVFFRQDGDVFVASRRSMDPAKVRPGALLEHHGKPAVIESVDDQVDTAGQGARFWKWGAGAGTAFGVVMVLDAWTQPIRNGVGWAVGLLGAGVAAPVVAAGAVGVSAAAGAGSVRGTGALALIPGPARPAPDPPCRAGR